MKFSVGAPVGGPVTYTTAEDAGDDVVEGIFAVGNIQQVFMTADFISVTKLPDADWSDLVGPVRAAIETAYA